MQVIGYLREVKRRNGVLYLTGLINLVIAGLMMVGLAFDARQVLGINVWIKPLKFALSIALFTWTVAWLTEYVKQNTKSVSRISWTIAVAMVAEILCIAGQSVRGVASHFNVNGPLDNFIFSTMGVMIFINTCTVIALLGVFLRSKLAIPKAYAIAIKLGLMVFIFGSLEGIVMIVNKAHTIGMLDGGPGLPWFNWSTRAGDLRVSHFLGLHAIQVIPLFGWMVQQHKSASKWVAAFAMGYFALMLGLFVQAVLGYPLLAL